MTWKAEIFRAFFVAFGAFEIISNSLYLIRKNGMDLAKKQHQELPTNINRLQIKIKVICMLIFGTLFFLVGFHSYISHTFQYWQSIIVLTLFTIYAIIEGCYYRYWRTFGFSCVSAFLLVSFLILK